MAFGIRVQLVQKVAAFGIADHAQDTPRVLRLGTGELPLPRISEYVVKGYGIPWIVSVAVILGCQDRKWRGFWRVVGTEEGYQIVEL